MRKQFQEVVLPDSGATVRVKFVGPLLLGDIMKAARREVGKVLPKPAPPMQEVPYQTGTRLEPNPLHPDYEAALAEHENAVGQAFAEKLFRYGVDVDLDDSAKAQVAALRAEFGEEAELPENDKALYVTRVLVQSNADFVALQNAIMGRVQPSEAGVAAATEAFPAAV